AHGDSPLSGCSKSPGCTTHRHSRWHTTSALFRALESPPPAAPPNNTTSPAVARLRCRLGSPPALSSGTRSRSHNRPSCSMRLPVRGKDLSFPDGLTQVDEGRRSHRQIYLVARAVSPYRIRRTWLEIERSEENLQPEKSVAFAGFQRQEPARPRSSCPRERGKTNKPCTCTLFQNHEGKLEHKKRGAR